MAVRRFANPSLAWHQVPPSLWTVIGFLRFAGLMNAAVWFGAAVSFTVAIGPAIFSDDMRHLLGDHNFPYFKGAIAEVVIARQLDLQIVCGLIAVAHACAEWLYLGRPLHRFWTGLLAVLVAFSLLGDFAFQPKIKALHAIEYAANLPATERAAAGKRLGLWHGLAQAMNVLMLGGLAIYLWRVAHPVSTTHFVTPAAKFPG